MNKQRQYYYILFPLLSALLLFFAWPPNGLPYLVFIAFVPLLVLDEYTDSSPMRLFWSYYLAFFVFHLFAAWWMYSSTIIGSLLAHMFNALYMSLVMLATQRIKQKWGSFTSILLVFPAFWLTMEFVHFYWELSWPWFTLGHVFAEQTATVQWYRYTGSLGGSFWVLIINSLIAIPAHPIFHGSKRYYLFHVLIIIALIFLPILLSKWIKTEIKTDSQLKVMVVQPNIDPRFDKFDKMSQQEQLDIVKHLIEGHPTDLDLIVLPETMIIEPINEDSLETAAAIKYLRMLAGGENHIPVFTGAFTKKDQNIPAKDRKAIISKQNQKYVLYNSALIIQNTNIQVYHKTQLVPLVEKQPFYHLMKPIRNYIEKSGGFFGRYGTHNDHFSFEFEDTFIVPLICFESAYGGYAASNVHHQAGLIVLITNDGWWSTPGGYKQHLAYARLRALETGKSIIRAANTGVSGIINPYGNITHRLEYGDRGILTANVEINHELTFYTRYGDYIGWMALGLATIITILTVLTKMSVTHYNRRRAGISNLKR